MSKKHNTKIKKNHIHILLRKNESSGYRGFILTIRILKIKEYILT